MSPLPSFTITFSERIHARVTVSAPDEFAAIAIATRTFHDDCFRALEAVDGTSEILEFHGPDFIEVEADEPDQSPNESTSNA